MSMSKWMFCCAGVAALVGGTLYLANKKAGNEPHEVVLRAFGGLVGMSNGGPTGGSTGENTFPPAPEPTDAVLVEGGVAPIASLVDPVVAVAVASLPGHIVIEEPVPMDEEHDWLTQLFEEAVASMQCELSFAAPMAPSAVF